MRTIVATLLNCPFHSKIFRTFRGIWILFVAGPFFMLLGISFALATPLLAVEENIFRESANSRANNTPDERRKFTVGVDLAAKLGRENNYDAIPFLVKLKNATLLSYFANNFSGTATPALEELVIKSRSDSEIGPGGTMRLIRNYRSRALFEALLSDLRNQATNYEYAAQVIVRTSLPGIEAELTELLPRLDPWLANQIAPLLVDRRYMPAEPALVDLIHRIPVDPVELISAAEVVIKLGTPAILNAIVQRLIGLRSLPQNHARDEGLVRLIEVIGSAPPWVKLNRSLLAPKVIQGFLPEHAVRIVAMMKLRDSEEKRSDEVTAANFAHWIKRHNNEEVRSFIKRGVGLNADVNPTGKSHDRPLHAAVGSFNWEAMRLLLEAGADPNPRNWEDHTPLMTLVFKGKSFTESLDVPGLVAAKLLISMGANIDAANKEGITPLHAATRQRFNKMVELLVVNGANVNAEAMENGLHGLTPTQIAIDMNYSELEAFLRSKGGTVSRIFNAKRTLHKIWATIILAPFYLGR